MLYRVHGISLCYLHVHTCITKCLLWKLSSHKNPYLPLARRSAMSEMIKYVTSLMDLFIVAFGSRRYKTRRRRGRRSARVLFNKSINRQLNVSIYVDKPTELSLCVCTMQIRTKTVDNHKDIRTFPLSAAFSLVVVVVVFVHLLFS